MPTLGVYHGGRNDLNPDVLERGARCHETSPASMMIYRGGTTLWLLAVQVSENRMLEV